MAKDKLPASAQLTNLPLLWLVAGLLLCMGAGWMIERVDAKRFVSVAERTGAIQESEKVTAEDPPDEILANRKDLEKRIRRHRKKRRDWERRYNIDRKRHRKSFRERINAPQASPTPEATDESPEASDPPTEVPFTIDVLRERIEEELGDSLELWRVTITVVALVFGALGLLLTSLFVRVISGATVAAPAFGIAWFFGLDPVISIAIGAAGAVVGMAIGPRLLVAAMMTHAALAGVFFGGVGLGGGVYLFTMEVVWALGAAGAGALLGAMVGFKYYRQLFLTSYVINKAWLATFVLWLFWGDAFPHFWLITFGGLVIADGISARIWFHTRWNKSHTHDED